MSGYVSAGVALIGTAATIDANKAAKHQAKVAYEQQQAQLAESSRMQEAEMLQTAKLQEQALAAQRASQSASIAQAQKAAAESKAMMDKQLKSADESMNRATQNRPNTSRILSEAEQAGKAGVSGTMLTGSSGVNPSTLSLGKSTLLGS